MSTKSVFWTTLILVLAAASAWFWYSKGGWDRATSSPTFSFGDNLNGVVTQSTQKSDVGEKVTFLGLKGPEPKVLFGTGIETSLKKAFENEATLSIVQVAGGSGGVDVFVINKKTGTFSRAWAGNQLDVYSGSSTGYCH